MLRLTGVAAVAGAIVVSAAWPASSEPASGAIARVKAVTVQRAQVAPEVVVTGDVQARYETKVAFRVSGKISERMVEVGAHVSADQVLARLDRKEQESGVREAEASLKSAEAQAIQAKQTFERQQKLIDTGFTTRSAYDQAEQALMTAQSQVESMQAALSTAQEQLSYTELRPGVAGFVTARNAEVGQVVQAGTTILTIAQDGPRDAVFNVYEALLASPPEGEYIDVVLQSNRAVRARATLREVSPVSDASAGTVKVKAGLESTPPEMGLGAVVMGQARLSSEKSVTVPSSALYRWEGRPAVWLLGPEPDTVNPRVITIDRAVGNGIVVSAGLKEGDRVVTAGIQLLRPGQKVAVVATERAP